MKRLKENKGITLIALIITIIVLLILAIVAISAVQGDGIIAHAKNARNNYQTEQNTENEMLANYLLQLNNANSETIVEDEEEASDNIFLIKMLGKGNFEYYGSGTLFVGGEEITITGPIPSGVDINNVDFSIYDRAIIFEDELVYTYLAGEVAVCSNKNAEGAVTQNTPIFDKTNLSNIKTTMFGKNVLCIGAQAFKDCTTLTSIEIPNTITNILDEAFQGCSNLSSVKYNGTTYTSLSLLTTALENNGVEIRTDAFTGCTSLQA